jgi:N-acetylglucosaminyldiphosphoundecaprenol N-acetyl-beta-D-mannosaminyltransferase
MHEVNILGVAIDPIGLEELLSFIEQAIQRQERRVLAHVHVRALCIACEQEWFRQFLNRADLVFCDGMGVQLGARLLGERLPERLTFADWTWSLAERCAARGYSIYFLGNPPGVAEQAASRLRERYPGLRVVGAQDGFFDKTPGSPENEEVVRQINLARPDILMVGLGMPLQEQWLEENWPRLDATVALPCGAAFEYLSGSLKRGPRWMTQNYLEWLARLIISPRRYWRRYLGDNTRFLFWILRQKFFGNPSDGS